MEEEEHNVFVFRDDQPTCEATHEYEEELRIDKVPVVVDNGSYKCRAGWAYDAEPRLIFKNLVAKQRGKGQDCHVGNDIANIEVVKGQLKSQFDKNIVTHYDTQEQVFDHVFSHLGIDSEGSVEHPIVVTEPVCNPNYCRQQMSELLFECYSVPQVAYGVDALFSLYNNQQQTVTDGLIIACGYHVTHIIPVLDGHIVTSHCRRISIGGSHCDGFMQRLIQLRHSSHLAHMTYTRAEELMQNHARVAVDYQEEVKRWFSEQYYLDNVHKIQLPYNASTTKVDPELQKQRREEQGRRLKNMAARKREEKLASEQDKLQEFVLAQQILLDEDDDRRYKKILRRIGFETEEDLTDEINSLNNSIHKLMHQIQQDAQEPEKTSKGSEPKKPKIEKKTGIEDPPVRDDAAMKLWLEKIRSERRQLMNKRDERRRRRNDMTRRRTHASQQRMKKITELSKKSKKDDNFGMKDEDWNVYKEINKDGGDSDSDAEQEKIDELETYLKEYDPEFKDPTEQTLDIREYYRLHIAVEQFRVPELLFQPSMLGIDQAGIAETLQFVLNKFSPEEHQRLINNVFITGGCASFPHFKERMERELREMCPFGSLFRVQVAANPVLDAWCGARQWAMTPNFEDYCVSKEEYEELGGERLKEHFVTNRYFPTPQCVEKNSAGKSSQSDACARNEDNGIS